MHALIDTTTTPQEMELAKAIGEHLFAIYPGHMWGVTVQGGVAVIKNLSLEGQYGFVLHCHKLVNNLPNLKHEVMKAGGDLLERFRIDRTKGGAEQAHNFLVERMKLPRLKLPDWVSRDR